MVQPPARTSAPVLVNTTGGMIRPALNTPALKRAGVAKAVRSMLVRLGATVGGIGVVETRVGVVRLEDSPLSPRPSWPAVALPQQYKLPVFLTAQVWALPALIVTQSESVPTWVGVAKVKLLVSLWPSCPKVLSPQQ